MVLQFVPTSVWPIRGLVQLRIIATVKRATGGLTAVGCVTVENTENAIAVSNMTYSMLITVEPVNNGHPRDWPKITAIHKLILI